MTVVSVIWLDKRRGPRGESTVDCAVIGALFPRGGPVQDPVLTPTPSSPQVLKPDDRSLRLRPALLLAPYSSPVPRGLGWSWGGGRFLVGEVPL